MQVLRSGESESKVALSYRACPRSASAPGGPILRKQTKSPRWKYMPAYGFQIWRGPEPEDERLGILAKTGLRAWHNVYGDKSGSGAMGRKVSPEEVAALKHQVPQDHSLHCGFS